MSFAGKVWRLLVGIKDALALLFLLLFFVALYTVLSARPNPAAVREGALLLQLDGAVVEEPAAIDPLELLLSSAVPTREYAARELVLAIDEAAGDERITVLALDLSTFLGGGQVHLQEIGEALDRFRATGKPVLAYAVAYGDDTVMLASHASEVWVDPMGGAAIMGPGGEHLFYKGLLDRLKVKAHVFRVGTHKSGPEPYMRGDLSPEARANYEALYASLWQEWQAHVKKARPAADLASVTTGLPAWIEASGGNLARATLTAGLADKIGDRVQWGNRVAEAAGRDSWDDMPGSFVANDFDTWMAEVAPDGIGARSLTGGAPIGVITVAGEISDGMAGPGEAGAERIVQLLDEALNDDLKALVVRVDSPGGTVTGSEAIRRAILRHKGRGIPVVVSMGNVAASGGYWISTPADRIFAEPETVTGSIGVYGVIPTFEDTLAEIGVTTDGVKTTALSGQPDLAAGFTPETEALLQKTVEFEYGRFLGLVSRSRKITAQRADELAQGRVWDGGTARQLGLVDQFGGLEDALAWAAGAAKLKEGDWQPRYLGGRADPFDAMLAALAGRDGGETPEGSRDLFGYLAGRENRLVERMLADLDGLLQVRGMQARCLECPAPAAPPARASARREPLLHALLGRLLD